MKIAGIDPKSLSNEVLLVLPRGESEIVFRAKGLPDMGEFEALCPVPKPPGKLTKDGWVPNLTDPTYQQVLGEWAKKRLGYMVIRSLDPTRDRVGHGQRGRSPHLGELGGRPEERRPDPGRVQPRAGPGPGGQRPGRGQAAKGPRGFSTWSGADARRVLLAPHRTAEYAVWRACERLGIRPPGVKPAWDECGVETQALIVAFDQTAKLRRSRAGGSTGGGTDAFRGGPAFLGARFLTMKFTAQFSVPRIDVAAYRKALDRHMRT